MDLQHYPSAIAEAAGALNELDAQIKAVKDHIERIEINVEYEVAFDSQLKNDAQRKAKAKSLILSHPDYEASQGQLDHLNRERTSAVTYLELLRNQFAVAKLTKREAIARMEVIVG